MKTIVLLGLVSVLGVLLIAGCVQQKGNATPQPTNQLANPASVYCEQQGGKVKIVADASGNQLGICILKDGTECDEWKYYRGECPAGSPTPVCGTCPTYAPPSPDFCPNGKITQGTADSCGCYGPPKCEEVSCPLDKKVCPNGKRVSRVPPSCNFDSC